MKTASIAMLFSIFSAIPILLEVLSACLTVIDLSDPDHHCTTQTDFHEEVTRRLVNVLTTLLRLATPETVANTVDSTRVTQLLVCVAARPDLPVVNASVARLPGLLVFGDEARMAAIVDFLRPHVDRLLLPQQEADAPLSPADAQLMECCCALVTSIPRCTSDGRRLRMRLVSDLGLLENCVAFLWRMVPPQLLSLPEETALE